VPLEKIRGILPPGSRMLSRPAGHAFSLLRQSGRPGFVVRGGIARRAEFDAMGDAIEGLRQRLHLCVAEHAVDRVFIHAGVAAWGGRALICPGSTFAGKSSLISTLVKSGATYYSDEYAVFDLRGRVHPFPLPIGERLSGGRRRTVVIANPGSKPLDRYLFLFARYREGRKWHPSELTPAETVLKLLKNAPAMRRNPELVLGVIKKIALTGNAYTGIRGESHGVLDWLVLHSYFHPK
jgi:hypothetical protein